MHLVGGIVFFLTFSQLVATSADDMSVIFFLTVFLKIGLHISLKSSPKEGDSLNEIRTKNKM